MGLEIDISVGERLKTGRKLRQVSQAGLANMVGITFQQIQKYEKGKNRISVSRLCEISNVLDLPISFFLPPEFRDSHDSEPHFIEAITDLRGQIHNLSDRLEKIRKIAAYPVVTKENPPV